MQTKRGIKIAENKIFTGFKFIDEKLGGLQPDKLCCIGGDCDPIMGEQLSLSLLKGILDNNPDKSVILINCEKFPSLNCNIFAFMVKINATVIWLQN